MLSPAIGWPADVVTDRYDVAWLMFNWQYKLFRDRHAGNFLPLHLRRNDLVNFVGLS